MADRAAAGDTGAFVQEGLQLSIAQVTATQALGDLRMANQWYLSDSQVLPISIEGLREIVQIHRNSKYIMRRDAYRQERGLSNKWKSNTIQYAAKSAGMQDLTVAQCATITRRLWDKGWHGGNRCKDKRFKEGSEEYKMAQACTFCEKMTRRITGCTHVNILHRCA